MREISSHWTFDVSNRVRDSSTTRAVSNPTPADVKWTSPPGPVNCISGEWSSVRRLIFVKSERFWRLSRDLGRLTSTGGPLQDDHVANFTPAGISRCSSKREGDLLPYICNLFRQASETNLSFSALVVGVTERRSIMRR